MLMVGIVFLGQYHSNLIETKLESFSREIALVSESISENAIENGELNSEKTLNITQRIHKTLGQRIQIFNKEGLLVVDSNFFENSALPYAPMPEESFFTVRVLKNMARFIIKLLPQHEPLPKYLAIESNKAKEHPNIEEALKGDFSLSAWRGEDDGILLSGAAPLHKNANTSGALLLTHSARDITKDIGDVWLNILGAFMMTLIITILLSIYLSGVIANPLRKLARAAEGVRSGKISLQDIPDFSHRKDEIGELSVAFKEMTSALSERMDSIERFAADVAHELKNPLTSLRSATETAAIVKDPEDKEKLMQIVHHDIERLDRLITDISHASRLDSELSRDVFERISLRSVLNALLNAYKAPLNRVPDDQATWRNQAAVESVKIECQSDIQGDIFVMGHTGRLEQVFQNILGNALSFSPENGSININVTTDKKRVSIVFEDEGPGIPANKIDSIFDRFYTQRPEHEDYGKHSGLGLSICKQIIIAMGGEIFAENIIDENSTKKGARFTIRLKIA